MASRIRTYDWTATPLGPADGWPERLRGMVDLILTAGFPMVVLWGAELVQIYNDGYRDLMGRKHTAGLGQPTRECWPEVWAINEPIYERVWAGETLTFEDRLYPITRANVLEEAWFTLSYSPLRQADGAVVGVLVTVVETTARHLADARLRESETRFRAFVTASADVVYRMGPDWSELRQLRGQSFLADTEEPSRSWMDRYIDPEDRERVTSAIQGAILDKRVFELEHRVRQADGSLGWTSSRAVPIINERGEITEWIGAAKDVTTRRRADEALRESEERQSFLLRLGDALRAEPSADAVAMRALRMLIEHMQLDRSYITVYRLDDDRADVTHQLGNGRVPPLPDVFDLSDYPVAFRETLDRTVVIEDDFERRGLTEAEKRASAALGMRAMIGATLRKGERHPLWSMVAIFGQPRRWTRGEISLVEEVAERTWAAMERARAEAAVRASEERFRAFAENSADTIWIASGNGTRLDYLSPAFEQMFGEDRAGVMTDLRRWAELLHPEDREDAVRAMPRTLAGEMAVVHYRVVRPSDGRLVHLRDTGFPIRNEAGAVVRVAGIVQDVSDMVAAREALEAEKERFRTLAEGVTQLIWRSADEGRWIWSSPQWLDYTGQTQDQSHGLGWLDAVHPEDRGPTMAAWSEAGTRGGLEIEYRVRRAADGEWRWHQTRAVPVRAAAGRNGAKGRILEWLGSSSDIEDLKRLQAHQQVLIAELQHRTRNLLAVVQNVARRSFGASEERDTFQARLSTLGRVQGFLSRSANWAVPLTELVEAELVAVGDGATEKVVVSGPPISVPGEKAQTLALALHELATNAAKYGALAQESAGLTVRWHFREESSPGGSLVLEWMESGVAMPPGPPQRRGFGSELIERVLPYQLKAETRREFLPDGLHCTIILPLVALRQPGETA